MENRWGTTIKLTRRLFAKMAHELWILRATSSTLYSNYPQNVMILWITELWAQAYTPSLTTGRQIAIMVSVLLWCRCPSIVLPSCVSLPSLGFWILRSRFFEFFRVSSTLMSIGHLLIWRRRKEGRGRDTMIASRHYLERCASIAKTMWHTLQHCR